MARLGGLIPSGGTLIGENNLAEICDSSKARENLQLGDAFDLAFDSTHGIVMVDRSTGTKYRLYMSGGNINQEVVS